MESAPYATFGKSRLLLAALYLVTATAYLAWRAQTLNPDARVFSWLLYGAEIYGSVVMFLLLFVCWRLNRPVAADPPDDLTIDVLVSSHEEPADTVRQTLLAVTRMEQPHQTWLLDDGNRPAMRLLAERLGCRYLARSDHTENRAGSLNHALAHNTSDLVAIFEAGQTPQPDFLTRTLGYFQDPDVAFVQTPVESYNLDSYLHRISRKPAGIWTEQSLFSNVIQRGKDYWNAALFCGSCAILRRSSLDAIGGFAIGTLSEGLHTSLRLHAQGYRSVYHPEPLAYGIAPPGADTFLRQRLHWGRGAMQVWRREQVLSNGKLSLPQRICYFSSMLAYFAGWQRAILYTAPAIILLSGTLPIDVAVTEFLVYFIPYLVLSLWTHRVITRGYGHSLYDEQYHFARFAVFCRSTLTLFQPRTSSRAVAKSDDNPQKWTPLYPQVAVFGLNLVALPTGVCVYLLIGHVPLDALLVASAWSTAVIAVALSLFRFTARNMAQRRRHYRFHVPVCASIALEGQLERLVTATNISSGGLQFVGKLPGPAKTEQRLTGHLYLPGGKLSFSGIIRAIRERKSHSEDALHVVSCEFGLLTEDAAEQLEGFLHGSDMQWHFLGSSDALLLQLPPTPGQQEEPAVPPAWHWSCCTYLWPVQFDLKRFYGVISMVETARANVRYLVVSQPLNHANTILVRPEAYGNESVLTASLKNETQIRTADGSVYLYTLEDFRETDTWIDEAISA